MIENAGETRRLCFSTENVRLLDARSVHRGATHTSTLVDVAATFSEYTVASLLEKPHR
jgi:hypothetical protein